jgi:AcrR family transcriptional regulator
MMYIIEVNAGGRRAGMRLTNEKVAENKARVFETAARLFREKGSEGVAVADLMPAAGLTHGGFYNHFESKDGLAAQPARRFSRARSRRSRGSPPSKARSGAPDLLTPLQFLIHLRDEPVGARSRARRGRDR